MPFEFFNPRRGVTVTHGHLPHWDQEGTAYFITWRTADSLPKQVWQRWRIERQWWLQAHGIDPSWKNWRSELERLGEEERREFQPLNQVLEEELDTCHGTCVLRSPAMAEIVAATLRFEDGAKYRLGGFVVMPNHVHVIAGGLSENTMLQQVRSWKRWSALKINEARGCRGRLWQEESFDHLIRSAASLRKFQLYIANNPTKAGLKPGEYLLWPGSDG